MILETERLYLRHFVMSDARRLAEYRSKPEVMEYQSWDHYTLQDAQDRILYLIQRQEFHKPKTDYHLAIILKETQTLIGDLFVEIVNRRIFVLGYTFDSDYWSHGYATEMVSAFIQYMKETFGFKKVICYAYIDNVRSIRLLQRLHFMKFDESYYYNDVGYIKKIK